MNITKIGFGITKNLGNYQNLRIYLEADLELGEDADIALDVLRTRVADEANFGDEYRHLRERIVTGKIELSELVIA
ncbi:MULTISPECIES: hypothetical protein [unclassified Microcoleus]|uniref:hypothetical protein n=1 Tax=unclassified Microcoleus TaxID=2642155 RepID=UPI002FD261DA